MSEHLARWLPAFCRRVRGDAFYESTATHLHETLLSECSRHGIEAGNPDLNLRPVEEFVDPCGACGLHDSDLR